MQKDFHYYATYAAAIIAGYSHEESMEICYSAQFVDLCTKTFLKGIGAPVSAATTQIQTELIDARTDMLGLQDITRIWASFHFLPRDLYVNPERKCSKRYRNKFRLICGPNGDLLVDTVNLAKGAGTQAVGIAMHVLADTWAHQYFAGTPSLVINNTNDYFYEMMMIDGEDKDVRVKFRHSPSAEDDLDNHIYTNSLYQTSEKSIMNLGHGRAGHFPDYSFARYKYMPAWANYRAVIKDNPMDYASAFTQMIYAMKFLRGEHEVFEKEKYDVEAMMPWKHEILSIIVKRQLDACDDWKAFGEKLSGCEIEDFDIDKYRSDYVNASENDKDLTFLGKFMLASMAQKSMVTNRIYTSGNRLAGRSVDYVKEGFKGNKDFAGLVKGEGGTDD